MVQVKYVAPANKMKWLTQESRRMAVLGVVMILLAACTKDHEKDGVAKQVDLAAQTPKAPVPAERGGVPTKMADTYSQPGAGSEKTAPSRDLATTSANDSKLSNKGNPFSAPKDDGNVAKTKAQSDHVKGTEKAVPRAIDKPPGGDEARRVKKPGGKPRFGSTCGSSGSCPDGLECVTFYGIAGAAGPKFQTCEQRCGKGRGLCPSGSKCVTIADGPGQVCR